jgi:protein-L-isoaspartate(D-aspartate) O-methyltransferase
MKKNTHEEIKSSEKKAKNEKPSREGFLSRIESFGVSKDILKAFSTIKQQLFFDHLFKDKFYGDEPFPIKFGQMCDNFFMLARMIHYLNPQKGQRILEIGTGSGYSTAILSTLCREVVTIDISEKLALSAKGRLYENDFGNIRFFAGDGTTIEEEFGKIDGVIIHAACKKRPIAAMKNLAFGGKMVYPMGPAHMQQIVVIHNIPDTEKGGNFKVDYHEEGIFTLIRGPYGYDNIEFPEEFFEKVIDADEKEPPKKMEHDIFLFKPNEDGD